MVGSLSYLTRKGIIMTDYKHASEITSKAENARMRRAIAQAELSDCYYQHGAVIYRAGSVLGVGVNVIKNDPVYVGPACVNPDNHAETMAIRSCRFADLSNAVLYVARVNRVGEPRNSMPCRTCQDAIEKAGIKRVIYT